MLFGTYKIDKSEFEHHIYKITKKCVTASLKEMCSTIWVHVKYKHDLPNLKAHYAADMLLFLFLNR
jgi:hypothetical protein